MRSNTPTSQTTCDTKTSDRPEASTSALASDRHVVEHALINYGYSPETARLLVDRLIAEGGNS